MKNLSNVSPFLLLLFPVFIMMLLTFTMSDQTNQNEEAVAKTTNNSSNLVIKATSVILK